MQRHVQRDVRWHQFRRQLRMPSGHLRVLRAHYHRRAVLRLPRLPRAQFAVQRVRTLRFSALSAAPTASSLTAGGLREGRPDECLSDASGADDDGALLGAYRAQVARVRALT